MNLFLKLEYFSDTDTVEEDLPLGNCMLALEEPR